MNTNATHQRANVPYKAKAKTRYSIQYLLLQERLFHRLANTFKFINLMGGSAAFISVFVNQTPITAFSGLLIAITTTLDFVIKTDERAKQCLDVRLRYQKLLNDRRRYTPEEYAFESGKIGMMQAPSISGLQYPAYNDTVRQLGHSNRVHSLTKWQRFLKCMV
ncbi:MAG: hypothetical protein GYB28_01655 [Gammaproteobacteria bacterium]|nr:hypothetical protein [Gammaproteobacteria bacterium]